MLKWAELLQIRSNNQVSYKAMLLYYGWLQDKIAKNVPTDEWVKELLGANGGTFKNPATNYYQLETDVLKVTENVAQVFMGMRDPVCPVPQPPVRPLDDGRLLLVRRLSSPRSAARAATTRANSSSSTPAAARSITRSAAGR